MAIYVLVAADGQDKNIMGGPFDVNDPNTIAVPEGQRLMTEEEAFAQGYHFAEGGGAGFTADRQAGVDASLQGGEDATEGGEGAQGPQGVQGGQGSQVQPGSEGAQGQQ